MKQIRNCCKMCNENLRSECTHTLYTQVGKFFTNPSFIELQMYTFLIEITFVSKRRYQCDNKLFLHYAKTVNANDALEIYARLIICEIASHAFLHNRRLTSHTNIYH